MDILVYKLCVWNVKKKIDETHGWKTLQSNLFSFLSKTLRHVCLELSQELIPVLYLKYNS